MTDVLKCPNFLMAVSQKHRVTTTTKCTHVVVVLEKSKYFALIYQLTQSNNQPSISSTFLINSIIQFNCTKISHEFSYKYHFSWSIFCTFIARKSKLNAWCKLFVYIICLQLFTNCQQKSFFLMSSCFNLFILKPLTIKI